MFHYIAMEESRRTYILMNQEEMNQCKDLGRFYLCPGKSPIYEASTREACESALPNDPTAEAFRLCEVQVSYKKDPYFQPIKSLGGWIYSLLTGTTAEVICPSRTVTKLQVTGIGILQIATGCSLRTSEMTLPSPSLQRQVSVAIYEPYLHLNLTELSPALLRNSQLTALPATEVRLPENISNKRGKYKKAEETLDQLENHLNEISSQEQARVKQTILTHDSYLGIGHLVVGLAIYVCRTKLLAMTTGKRYCLQRKGRSGVTQATQHLAELGINQEVNPEQDEAEKEKQEATYTEDTPATRTRSTRILTSANPVSPGNVLMSTPSVRLPLQHLQPM